MRTYVYTLRMKHPHSLNSSTPSDDNIAVRIPMYSAVRANYSIQTCVQYTYTVLTSTKIALIQSSIPHTLINLGMRAPYSTGECTCIHRMSETFSVSIL